MTGISLQELLIPSDELEMAYHFGFLREIKAARET